MQMVGQTFRHAGEGMWWFGLAIMEQQEYRRNGGGHAKGQRLDEESVFSDETGVKMRGRVRSIWGYTSNGEVRRVE